jgi:hypothetical protein
MSATDSSTIEAWLEIEVMCFTVTTSSTKVCIGDLQLKGTALLWRKTLLPQLNMVVKVVLGEQFKERFREKKIS